MFASLALLAAVALQPGDVPANAVLGTWQTTTRHGVVQVSRCGPSICGRLVDSDGLRADPQLRDIHNQNADLRQRPLRNLPMLDGFHWNGTAWAGGWIYNGEDGGTYHATVHLDDPAHLTVKGCIVWPLCRSVVWTRVR